MSRYTGLKFSLCSQCFMAGSPVSPMSPVRIAIPIGLEVRVQRQTKGSREGESGAYRNFTYGTDGTHGTGPRNRLKARGKTQSRVGVKPRDCGSVYGTAGTRAPLGGASRREPPLHPLRATSWRVLPDDPGSGGRGAPTFRPLDRFQIHQPVYVDCGGSHGGRS